MENGPFDVPDFWLRSAFSLSDVPEQTLFADTQFELPLIGHDSGAALQLADIESFEFGKFDDFVASEDLNPHSSVSDHAPSHPSTSNDALDDLWELDDSPQEHGVLRTWEAFADVSHTEPRISCISEAGPRAFDALQSDDSDILQSAFTLKCLGLLGLGRSSALFQRKKEHAKLEATIDRVRLSGFSSTAFDSVVARLSTTGCRFSHLRHFVQSSYADKHPLSARIALATSLQAILEALDHHLADRVLNVQSTLQLLAFFETPSNLLAELEQLVQATSHVTTDSAFLTTCHDVLDKFTYACSPFINLHTEVLNQVSRPWYQNICREVGLLYAPLDAPVQDESLRSNTHISAEECAQINEITTSLAILKNTTPDHPLLQPASWGVDQPDLEASATQVGIDRIVEKADKYQKDLLAAISQYNKGDSKPKNIDIEEQSTHLTSEQLPWSLDESQQVHFEDIAAQFSQFPVSKTDTSSVQCLNTHILSNEILESSEINIQNSTPLQRLRPFLNVQTRLLNGTLLRLLFRQSSLRDHLSLNHSFHLLGNGLFVQYLTAALFTSEDNAQGLRLDNRSKQWPPASSELRLGLMGVLSEAYGSSEIPGNLSFAIRELGDLEIERCMDANSIFALDFLRLRYEAPAPLDVVLDDAAMAKYDDCFRVLLGVLRMLHFVTVLRRTAQEKDCASAIRAFAHEAWNCVSSLASYFFDIGITGPWKEFQTALDKIEESLRLEDDKGTFGQKVAFGIPDLRNSHHEMLDTIRSRLFLRSRHAKLKSCVEDIFGFILAVRHISDGAEQRAWKRKDELRTKVEELRGVLQELVRKIGKKRNMTVQDRDDVFAAEVLDFRLGA